MFKRHLSDVCSLMFCFIFQQSSLTSNCSKLFRKYKKMGYLEAFKRKKPLEDGNDGSSQLDRVLGVFDLTSLGVGATLGKLFYIFSQIIFMFSCT